MKIRAKLRVLIAAFVAFICGMLLAMFTSCKYEISSPINTSTPEPAELSRDESELTPSSEPEPEITQEPISDKKEALYGYWYCMEPEELIVIKKTDDGDQFIRYADNDRWQAAVKISNVEFTADNIRYIWTVEEKTLTLYVGDAIHVLKRVDEEDELHYENYFLAALNTDPKEGEAVPRNEDPANQMTLLSDGNYELVGYGSMTVSSNQHVVTLIVNNLSTYVLECADADTTTNNNYTVYTIINNLCNGFIEVSKTNNSEIYLSLTDLNNRPIINRTICNIIN